MTNKSHVFFYKMKQFVCFFFSFASVRCPSNNTHLGWDEENFCRKLNGNFDFNFFTAFASVLGTLLPLPRFYLSMRIKIFLIFYCFNRHSSTSSTDIINRKSTTDVMRTLDPPYYVYKSQKTIWHTSFLRLYSPT